MSDIERTAKTTLLLAALVKLGAFPGATRGELRREAGLAPDCEVTRPIRDLRKPWNDVKVRWHKWAASPAEKKLDRYYLDEEGMAKAKALLAIRLKAAA